MNQGLHLKDIIRIIRKHQLVVFGFLIGIFSIALGVNFMMTPEYEAKTKLVIERSEQNDLTERTPNIQRDPEFYETQYQLIKSQAVAQRVVNKLAGEEKQMLNHLLANRQGGGGGLVVRLKSLAGNFLAGNSTAGSKRVAGEDGDVDPLEQLAKAISDKINVRPVENSRMVQISFPATDPRFASKVTNSVVESYMAEINQMKTETTRKSLDWMNRKAEGEAKKLQDAEENLQRYMGENSVLTLENRLAVLPEKLARISTDLIGAESRRQELEALNAKVSRVADDPEAAESVSAILADPALQRVRTEMIVAEKNILELSGKFGEKHPLMQKAQKDLEIMKQKKMLEITRIARSIENEYDLAKANERNLRAQMEEIKGEALKMNEKFMTYQALKAGVDTNRKLFDALVTRMKEEGITSESQSVKIWVVEKAGIPRVPARPNKALNLSLGAIFGLLGGLGLAFLREYFDNTIDNPDEVESAFRAPVLGTVSLCRRERIENIVLEKPLSALSECYKSLRTTLLADGMLPQRYLITSSLPGEGKTTMSINLALALAQADLRVLLMDADLRKPKVHSVLRLENRVGLSGLLTGPIGDRTLAEALQQGPIPGLSVLTSGPIPPNPSELLMCERMKELLKMLEKDFDILLCDSPPVLAVEDSRILSRRFDGTLLVARAHRTTFPAAARALKMLADVKAPLLGLVINALDQRKSDYYYHSQYYTAYQPQTLKLKG